MSGKKAKKIFNISCIVISIIMVLFIVFSNQDLPNAWKAIFTLDFRFFFLGVLCYFGYIFMEGLGLYLFLRMHKHRIHFLTALHFSFVGIFYANITPGATGGQPMQVIMMSEKNIPVGTASSGLTVRLLFNQVSVVLTTLILWLTHRAFFKMQLAGVIVFVIVGLAVNLLPIPLLLLAAYHNTLLNHIVDGLMKFLNRCRIVRNSEKISTTLRRVLGNYHDSMQTVAHHPLQLLSQFLVSIAETFFLMMVPVAVYFALYQSGTSWHSLLSVSYALFSSASYTPLPGASGAQEGGFLLYFRGLFNNGTLPVALLIWRFITYYLCLICGAVDGIVRAIKQKYSHSREEKQ